MQIIKSKNVIIGENCIIKDIDNIGKNVTIGHNNVIEDGVVIGDGVSIGNNNTIMKGTIIDNDTKIEHYVLLKNYTVVGKECYVDSYFRSSGDNKIGDNVTLRFGSTIARKVYVEDDVFISPNVMTVYSKHTGEQSKGTFIKKGAFIGTAAVIGANVTIGEGVVIAAQAYVSKNCIEKGIYIGVPAKFKKGVE